MPETGVSVTTQSTLDAGGDPTAPGCDGTQALAGSVAPSWAVGGAPSLRFVQSTEKNVVGFLFADPLRVAPRADGRNNKILWVVKDPRHGDLRITGRHDGMEFSQNEPADSGPGEIYPSIVDAPEPGCWHLTLEWSNSVATVNLLFLP